jgi:penicillin-binding protein 1A
MGIRTPISTNPAMTLGGLEQGVTPLDMAHAYETFQTGGRRVTGTLGSSEGGPVGISEVREKNGRPVRGGINRKRRIPVLSRVTAQTATQIMSTVVSQGSGKRAALDEPVAGKTGTTENSATRGSSASTSG